MRLEFSRKTRAAAFLACKGRCENCGDLLVVGNYRFNHFIPCAFSGPNSVDNCQVLCLPCDRHQTYRVDLPRIAKAKRIAARHAGKRKPRTMTRWRRFDGTIVTAPRERKQWVTKLT